MDSLTHSRLFTLRQCPRKHYLRYECRLARSRVDEPLRIGKAFHLGMEAYNRGFPSDEAVAKAVAGYDPLPAYVDAGEPAAVQALLSGHFWRYSEDNIEIVNVEREFAIPLINPDTGKPSRTFVLMGKIDAIVRLADGRLAVLEYKTAGEDIGVDSPYWLRLRVDPQISMYYMAARALGYDVQTVLYNVTRKPTSERRLATPEEKRKYKADGTLYANQRDRDETPDEYAARILEDIAERPDYYYARREIPRMEDDLADFQSELWQQAQQLIETRKRGRWFRNPSRWNCQNCEFAELCLHSVNVTPGGEPPAGYEITDLHPELTGD